MREPDRGGYDFVKDRGLQLNREEVGIVRIQTWVQVALDGGEVDAVVFRAGVISGDKDADSGQNR